MNKIERFLIFCSGAYLPLVKRCPGSIHQFIGIGGTVLFTAVFAGLSVGYALFTVFDSIWPVLAVGILWMLMIFNLDRYIVSTLKKREKFSLEFKQAIPRLILAILIALVIAKPLELKIFEKEINRELDRQRLETIQESKNQIKAGYPEIQQLQGQIDGLNAEIKNKENYRNEKQLEYDNERFGVKTDGTTGRAGIGINAEKKEEQLDQAQQDLLQTQALNREKIQAILLEIDQLNDQMKLELDHQMLSVASNNGLAARIHALDSLTNANNAVYWANLMIMLLFVMIEMAPILVKLLAKRGAYDHLLDTHEAGVILYADEQWHKKKSQSDLRKDVFDEIEPERKVAQKNFDLGLLQGK
ncbi:DUF4407 domain-containing protein [uncultured Cyclobacterium sp.]|uniref:DUF4407 domain-containing protein n=1 Tax=uncultured Cyclobacterium sp. TaxID=453820 RepID=UPI0030EC3F25